MTQAKAVAKLKHNKYSTRWVKFEVFDDFGVFDDVYASARTDSINTYVNRVFRRLRDFYRDNAPTNIIPGLHWTEGTIRLGPIWEIGATTYNVGSYESVSKFQNQSDNIALGKANAEDSEADQYTGTIYWEYYDVKRNGSCYFPPKKMYRDFDFTTISERHAIPFDACKSNQMFVESPKN